MQFESNSTKIHKKLKKHNIWKTAEICINMYFSPNILKVLKICIFMTNFIQNLLIIQSFVYIRHTGCLKIREFRIQSVVGKAQWSSKNIYLEKKNRFL
jgi:hypothetical protein